jgi:dTDP-D-glucose 4,6-dehydratase
MRIFVTGGTGFIGSAPIRHLVANTDHVVLNYDKLAYAATLSTVTEVAEDPHYQFSRTTSATPTRCARPSAASPGRDHPSGR